MEMTYLEAIRQALFEEMRRDDRVFILGEDIGVYGGAFKVTQGLLEEFGPRRVIDTPMCEIAIVGSAVGAAMMGMRPVAEIQFADFMACAFDQIVNVAGTSYYRWQAPVPIVIRAPSGCGVRAGPFHSQNPEAWFCHAPGLKVVVPATAYDAKGLLKAAIRDADPVIYLENKYLYRRIKEEIPDDDYTVPLGEAIVRRAGDDVSLIAYGAMVHEALAAADELEHEGISAEVLDLRTLVPLDEDAVLATVRKTGKVLITHEANRTAGFGAELAALIAEQAFEYLDGPVVRVTAPDTPVPYSPPLEDAYRPNAAKIAEHARRLAAY
jgi:2-oxoisovalerate dehydrogenase E1 component beta subunit